MLRIPNHYYTKERARASTQCDPPLPIPSHARTLKQENAQEVYKEVALMHRRNLDILYKRNSGAVTGELLPTALHPENASRPSMHRHPLPQAAQALTLRQRAGSPPPVALPDHAPRFLLLCGFFDEDLSSAVVVVVENLLARRGGLLGGFAAWRLGLLEGERDGLQFLGFLEGVLVWSVV